MRIFSFIVGVALTVIATAGETLGAGFTYGDAFIWSEGTGLRRLGSGYATAINNSGAVVGFDGSSAFYWSEATGRFNLPSLGLGGTTEARGINDLGQVVGTSGGHAFLWSVQDGIIDIGSLGGFSRAYSINNSGQVVGESWTTPYGLSHAFLWDKSTGMTDLGTSTGAAYDINASGTVVGRTGTGTWAPISYSQPTGTQYLTSGIGGYAIGINDIGQIVGGSWSGSNMMYPVLWNPDGSVVNLGTLGGPYANAQDINNLGQVVGFGDNASDTERRAYLWTAQNGLQDLFGISSMASDINDSGYIVGGLGFSSDPNPDHGNDDEHGHHQPVPEPSTIILLGAGLVGLAAYGRKKSKK